MGRVAIAGGTSGLGCTIVDSILAMKQYEVFILSRSSPPIPSPNPTLTYLQIDYTSPSSISISLKENGIDNIISVLQMNTPDSAASQLTLIKGASISGTVTRFASSEFRLDYLEASAKGFPFLGMDLKVAAIEKLKATKMEYTRFINGTFIDYLLPTQPSNLQTVALLIDYANSRAVIPGNGSKHVVFTHSTDVGNFVTDVLGREIWDKVTFIVGSRSTLNKIVEVAESVSGQIFEVEYVSEEELKEMKIPELQYNAQRYEYVPKGMVDGIFSSWGLAVCGGWLDIGPDEKVGEGMMGVRAFLKRR